MSNNTEHKVIANSNEWINWIEESIAKGYTKYYDYKHFNNIQEIGFGGFGKVYRANWKNSHDFLALKSFINFNIAAKEIVNELKLQRDVDFRENIIRFYGISTENQSDNSGKYFLVMEYVDSGTLRNYLSEHSENLIWNDKLNLALQLANAISWLHDKKIMHHDLHSNNILVQKKAIKLADFGLSKRIKKLINFQSNLFEIVAYIDPKIFNIKGDINNQNQVYSLNKKSEIYSIGILFWELSSGRPPFCNKSYNIDLAMEILQGLREKPIPNTPEGYVKIYTECSYNDPDKRPTANQIIIKLNEIISDFQQNNFGDIQLSSITISENNNNLLHEKMSQIIQNFSKINIKEKEPSISSSLIIDNFSMVVNELTILLENIETNRGKYEIINYLKNHNITSQEFYNWLLNNQDNSDSIVLLGVLNHFGIVISVDEQKAFGLYLNAAILGNVYGIICLGYCYGEGIGTSINKQKAFELFQEAANLGNSRGIYNLGYCYLNGIGISVDKQMAFESCQKVASKGFALGMAGLGYCYEKGFGTSVDGEKAFELYQKAANLGNVLGICNLGCCYLNGLGTSVDNQKAFEIFQNAADMGDNSAQYNLAYMYENGKGIEKDIDQAIYWYKKSAEQGDQDAQDKINELINY
ncbi:kinase-like protein [Rhizophagus irregularis]|uniref:Kinase-like protein n=1 Tax=Rhizophagus irregularis TaxID=588596 RepID=A0A2N1MRN7_9GLOM|nr:kinase-like protein [Rhizophagus irregularis]